MVGIATGVGSMQMQRSIDRSSLGGFIHPSTPLSRTDLFGIESRKRPSETSHATCTTPQPSPPALELPLLSSPDAPLSLLPAPVWARSPRDGKRTDDDHHRSDVHDDSSLDRDPSRYDSCCSDRRPHHSPDHRRGPQRIRRQVSDGGWMRAIGDLLLRA